MGDSQFPVARLLQWYRGGARAFLEQYLPNRIGSLDEDLGRLEKLQDTPETLPICFLGNAAVGKSTLINALVGKKYVVLPAGGIGPLTAQATRLVYAERPYFVAEYHGRTKLNQVLFALERDLDRDLTRTGGHISQNEQGPAQLTPDELADVEASVGDRSSEGSEGHHVSEKLDALAQQVALLIRGDQYAKCDRGYLLDSLRAVLELPPRGETRIEPEDQARVRCLKAIMASDKRAGDPTRRRDASQDLPGFLKELALNAAGFLAPLIRRLEVGWDDPLLASGIELVDLPGVGVANDEYRSVTTEWIRKARAVVLVVDRAGITEDAAEVLRTTGFLNSLLHEHDEAVDPPRLIVVMTKVDLSADEDRSRERQEKGPQARKFGEIFQDLSTRGCQRAHEMLERELRKMVGEGDTMVRDARSAAVDRILASVEIFAVSATEYRRLLEQDEDSPPKLKSEEATHIPALHAALRAVAERRRRSIRLRAREEGMQLAKRARSSLGIVLALWEGEGRAEEEAGRLAEDLESFVTLLKEDLRSREASFRTYLNETMKERIRAAVQEAALDALKEMQRKLRGYEKYPWATIRAAIRRGGAYDGARHIDLPNELTLLFEEPVAVIWSRKILTDLRRRTRQMGDDQVALVEQVVEWARGQGTKMRLKVAEGLYEELKAETSTLGLVGRDAIEDLKEKVKRELFRGVEKRVRTQCERFVETRKHLGAGVKNRMLQFLQDELAPAVLKVATPAAEKVLLDNYAAVEEEIREVFRDRANPLDRAMEALVEADKRDAMRSNAQKRSAVLAEGRGYAETVPGLGGNE